MQVQPNHRRGITLLEVLISVGILAVGLGSIVALVPAARSQAGRAVILDRAATLAANTLADAATCGLLRPSCVANGGSRPLLIDPGGASLGNVAAGLAGSTGIYSASVDSSAPAATQLLWSQSRDDVTINTAALADDPPTNLFVDGARAYGGRMTSLLYLQRNAGGLDRMSAVVFHARDPGLLVLSGTLTGTVLRIDPPSLAALGNRTVADVVQPGVVLVTSTNGRLHQVTSAVISGTGPFNAYMTFTSGTLLTVGSWQVQFLPGSVGFAERPFTPESTNPYLQ